LQLFPLVTHQKTCENHAGSEKRTILTISLTTQLTQEQCWLVITTSQSNVSQLNFNYLQSKTYIINYVLAIIHYIGLKE